MTPDLSLVPSPIDVVMLGSEALLRPHGELDMFGVARLHAAGAEVADADLVIVDLADVSFVDCAVMRLLGRLATERAGVGRQLRVDNAHGIVRRLMDVLRLDDLRGV